MLCTYFVIVLRQFTERGPNSQSQLGSTHWLIKKISFGLNVTISHSPICIENKIPVQIFPKCEQKKAHYRCSNVPYNTNNKLVSIFIALNIFYVKYLCALYIYSKLPIIQALVNCCSGLTKLVIKCLKI